MLKILKSGSRKHYEFRRMVMQTRSFLSEKYRCEEEWNDRLKSPLLQKYKPEELFVNLNQQMTNVGKINAVDVDIFANSIVEKDQIEELLILLQNLRNSAETTNTLDSTHHAVIRFLLKHNYTEELINVLYNRITFGIFPDDLSYNILMDTYLKREDYANAAKIAVLPMLQEDNENPITNALSIYTCNKYLENPDVWQKPAEPEENTKEEIKIRISSIRNPYFDDHFDLKDPYDLVGKTLAFHGKSMNNSLGRSCQLRGLILYKKYQDASKLINKWLNEIKGDVVFRDIFHLITEDSKNMYKEETPCEVKQILLEVDKLKKKNSCGSNLMEVLKNNIQIAINKQQTADINKYLKMYTKWNDIRDSLLEVQMEEIIRKDRMKNVAMIKEDLKMRERILTFFENEEKIELEIEKIKAAKQAELDRVMRMPRGPEKLKKLEKEQKDLTNT